VVIGEDGAEVYESQRHYDRYYDEKLPEPDYVN
jgi:hypothetical protein